MHRLRNEADHDQNHHGYAGQNLFRPSVDTRLLLIGRRIIREVVVTEAPRLYQQVVDLVRRHRLHEPLVCLGMNFLDVDPHLGQILRAPLEQVLLPDPSLHHNRIHRLCRELLPLFDLADSLVKQVAGDEILDTFLS